MEGAKHVEQRLESFRLVQDGKGDEQTHAGGIDGGCGNLQIARQLDLPFGLERIDIAADFEDVGGDGVTGGVVGALGGGGVGDADPLDSAGIVGRQSLVLDYRYPLDAEHLAGDGRAAAEHATEGSPFLNLFQQADCSCLVAELDDAGIHGDADGDAHLDGVHADVVVEEVEVGDGVQIVDAAMAAVGPDRLVLRLFGQVVAVLVVIDTRALDDAAAVAAVGGRAAALDFQLRPGPRRSDCCGTGELAALEVVGRIAARLR